MATITMKFGGTSLGSAEIMSQVAGIIQQATANGHRTLVVCSAMGGVTNMLLEGAHTAAAGNSARYHVLANAMRDKHGEAIRSLITSDVERIAVWDEVDSLVEEFETTGNIQ